MPPLTLTDPQLDVIHRLAWPLAPRRPQRLPQGVAQRLQEQATVGDGTVHRIAVECQGRFWTAAALGVR
jgi:hypothetical protein